MITRPKYADLHTHWLRMFHRDSIKFTILACSDAAIYLTHYVGVTTVHSNYVVFGADGNTMSYLYDFEGGTVQASVAGPALDCYHAQWFWLQWTATKITVGKGPYVGDQIILTWNRGSYGHSIEALGFVAKGDKDAIFKITELPGW